MLRCQTIRAGILLRAIAISFLMAVSFLIGAPPACAETLHFYSGPDIADDEIRLTDFVVSGPGFLELHDSIKVTFRIANQTGESINFGEEGVFVAARSPEGMNRNFGHFHQGGSIGEGASITLEASMEVDEIGTWALWPSYHILESNIRPTHYGPEEWHAAYLRVSRGARDMNVSVSIDPPDVESGSESQLTVRVTDGDAPRQGAHVVLSAGGGAITPDQGETDQNGEFHAQYLAPEVRSMQRYAITAVIELEGVLGEGMAWVNVIPRRPPDFPPRAYIDYVGPNPAVEGWDSVTFEGHGTDSDGEVVECRWTLPDGTSWLVPGDSDSFTLEPDEILEGEIRFAVRDNDGLWSGEIGEYLEIEFEEDGGITWLWPTLAIPLVVVLIVLRRIRKKGKPKPEETNQGMIIVNSDPRLALVFLDELFKGISPMTIPDAPPGSHSITCRKVGYFDSTKKVEVIPGQIYELNCDLAQIPGIELKVSADPVRIPADGKSTSKLTVRLEDQDEHPIPVLSDTEVELEAGGGTITSPVMIPAGRASTTATLTSSPLAGKIEVTAKCELWDGSITVEFVGE